MDRAKFNRLVMDVLGKGRDAAVFVDDNVQAAVRDHLLRLPSDGSSLPKDAAMRVPREFLGYGMHQARAGYQGNTRYRARDIDNDHVSLLGARALQAAGLTAAGAGLAQLTHQMQNEFGSPADHQPMMGQQYPY